MKKPKTALYRHYNSAGTLLYVGISISTLNRLSQHAISPWCDDIARVDIQYFESRAAALGAEQEAIKTECPLFNRAHKPRPLSPMEAIFAQIFNATDEECATQAMIFPSAKAGFLFLGEYGKYARRMKRKLAKP